MKLLITIVHQEDAENLINELIQKKYPLTKMESSGGFLKGKNITILIAVDDKKVKDVLKVIKENCNERTEYITPAPAVADPGEFLMPTPVKIQVGGATVFIIKIESCEKL